MAEKNIRVCSGMTCAMQGAKKIMTKIEKEVGLKAGEKNDKIDLGYCRCTGYCHMAPNVVVNDNLIAHADESTIVQQIDDAASGKIDNKIYVTDADLDEILNNDFLGDL